MYLNDFCLHYPEASRNADIDHDWHAMESQSERARAIAIDVANIRMQGVEPVPEFFEIAERYVSGELQIEQFTAAIDGLRRHQ